MTRTISARYRSGFTLIELLVVISIMIVLAAISAGIIYSGAIGSQQVVSGSDRASGWLLISKSRAQRDNAPRGVRFYLNSQTATLPELRGMVTEAQYLEQPDIWVPNPNQETNLEPPATAASQAVPTPRAKIVFVQNVYPSSDPTKPGQIASREVHLVGTTADLFEFDQRIFPGDQLILPELGGSFMIKQITGTQIPPSAATFVTMGPGPAPTGNVPSRRLLLAGFDTTTVPVEFVREPHLGAANSAAAGLATYVTFKFGFQPAPRVVMGDNVLQLTNQIVIDYRPPGINPMTGTAIPPALLTNEGYRDWSTPTPPALPTPNAGPFNPSTTTGVIVQGPPLGQQYFDVLFSPSGQVLNAPNGLICLWVRDSSKLLNLNNHPRLDLTGNCDSLTQYNSAGQQILVVIYTRTGAIATQQVAPPPAAPTVYDPYSFAKDGINAGL